MATIDTTDVLEWSNCHQTISLEVERHLTVEGDSGDNITPAQYFTGTREAVQGLISDALQQGKSFCTVGSAWSFSDIVRPAHWLLHTVKAKRLSQADLALASLPPRLGQGARRLPWEKGRIGAGEIFKVSAADVDPGAAYKPDKLVLAGGGARIGDLNLWLQKQNPPLSLRTSGASDGQSIAGAISTGTHGSVVTLGAIQDHVCGLHLVTGPNSSVWIERASKPALGEAFARSFAQDFKRDDAMFEAALVHLGAMGYVDAVLLDVVPEFFLELVQVKRQLDEPTLTLLRDSRFKEFALACGFNREPYFVQVILNPFARYGWEPMTTSVFGTIFDVVKEQLLGKDHDFVRKPALVRFLFKVQGAPNPADPNFQKDIIGEPVNLVARFLDHVPDEANDLVLSALMYKSGLYKITGENGPGPHLRWSETTPPYNKEGRLFSAAFAFRRKDLIEALKVMLPAFKRDGGAALVCTLRFVARSSGMLAFTSFDENVVVDLDGIDDDASHAAFSRVLDALLARPDIPFHQHMGKIGTIDAARIVRNYGAPATPGSAAHQWRAQRDMAVPAATRNMFGSVALRSAGLTS